MKKILLVSTAVIFSSMLLVQASSGQLINWERRKKYNQDNAASASTQAGVQRAQQQVQKQVMKQMDPQVVSRVERIYDVNGDGKLQANELKDFYTDVIDNVNRRGDFQVTDGVLKQFDTNGDDRISRYEVNLLEQALKK